VGFDIAVDAEGFAYVTGRARSANFPTTPGAFDVTFNGGLEDAFVTKLATNRKPNSVNDTATTNEDTVVHVSVLSNDSDPDGDVLAVSATTQGANGFVVINPDGTVAYTPSANFNGTDSFTYTISDGQGGTSTATVTVTVAPVNDAPVAADESYSLAEDSSLTVPATGVLSNDSDVENDALTAILVNGPSHGALSLNPDGSFSYTPAANFNGMDRFGYSANDGSLDSDVVTVSITVYAINDAPVAADDTATTPEDSVVSIGVLPNDTDVDNDSLRVISVTQGAHGSVAIKGDGTLNYTPSMNFNGADTFRYTVSDGNGEIDTASVTVTVTPVNDPPVASDTQALTDEDTPVAITLLGNDIDSSALSFSIVDAPLHGTLGTFSGNSVTYTPDPNYNGTDSFTYVANDGQADSNLATVSIAITPMNDPPVLATVGDKTIAESALLAFNLSASDPDGDVLTFSTAGLPEGATFDRATGAFSWTPSLEQAGSYTVTFTVIDPEGKSASETITIRVEDVITNQGPVCSTARPSIEEIWPPNHARTEVVDILGVTDPDNDPLTLVILRILQDEPTNTLGDGTTWVDGGGTGTPQAWVRAERSGTNRVPGNGRIYEIFFEASDGRGKTCTGSVKVGVPHDQGQGRPAVDDGKRYDSTIAGGPCLNCK
jgi:VCBS repeat-containing protein